MASETWVYYPHHGKCPSVGMTQIQARRLRGNPTVFHCLNKSLFLLPPE